MVAYFCHSLSDNYFNFSDLLYVGLINILKYNPQGQYRKDYELD